MWLSLEVLRGSNTLHICYHSDSLSVFKTYLQILISPIFLGDDRSIKKEMWQKTLYLCYANQCSGNIQKLEKCGFCGLGKWMFGETSNNIIINISQHEVMRADSWGGVKSLSPFLSKELGWLTSPQVGRTWGCSSNLSKNKKGNKKQPLNNSLLVRNVLWEKWL